MRRRSRRSSVAKVMPREVHVEAVTDVTEICGQEGPQLGEQAIAGVFRDCQEAPFPCGSHGMMILCRAKAVSSAICVSARSMATGRRPPTPDW